MTPEDQITLREKRRALHAKLQQHLCRSPALHGNGRPCPECKGGQRRREVADFDGVRRKPVLKKPSMVHAGFGRWEVCPRCRGIGRVAYTVEEVTRRALRELAARNIRPTMGSEEFMELMRG